jgi:7-carboxy-7-deazaguanine synthase
MPPPPTLKICEIFSSVQGEGLRQGEPTLFVRFTGCNLKCDFCDTKYAWTTGKDMSVPHIVEKLKRLQTRFPARWICLTGGEPLHQNIRGLVRQLKAENFKIQVETNATLYFPLPVDWYTISPKPPKYFLRPQYKEKAKEVKLVVTKGLEFESLQKLRRKFPEKVPILLQPQSNKKWSIKQALKLVRLSLLADLTNVRISFQMHKVFGWR